MDSLKGLGGAIVVAGGGGDGAPFDEGRSAPQTVTQAELESPRPRADCWPSAERFVGMTNEELGAIDPVVLNLAVAKGLPSLANLDIGHYVRLADQWAGGLRGHLPACEANFYRNPARWQNDLDFSHLALVSWFVRDVLHIDYREDQKNLERVFYTDPTDLFLNGVMETRRGTCGNMALLWVVLGRRLGWPVSLACVGAHFICRFDDGTKVINVEATRIDGFHSPPDRFYLAESEKKIPQRAVDCGSDLRALTPREMLAVFFGARARHLENSHRLAEAEPDYLVARYLFPRNRRLYINQNLVSVQNSMELFEPGEKGHPVELASWLREVVQLAPWLRTKRGHQAAPAQETRKMVAPDPKENINASQSVDAVLEEIWGGLES